ncbi:hypothetical protein JTB14_020368 [Gonioctena quinquepunctata]|nr:hypothetical protein JTB14_020368 [Gonioctena quinquepunctata]
MYFFRDPQLRAKGGREISLALMPFFHVYGLNFGITSIFNRDKLIIMNRFEPETFLRAIQDHRINSLILAPPLAVFMAKSPLLSKYDLSSIIAVFCGAAPLHRDIEDILKQRLKIPLVRQGYGLTEANLAITLMKSNDLNKLGSVGKVLTYMSIIVRDPESGKWLGPNKVGEICVKGPMMMKGYYRNEQATRETFTSDGWLKTGDLGHYDDDGYFYIVDRLKELIKYKGYQVAPAEIEALLINHPKVLDVGVVGAPDEVAGELPLAFVVKKEGVDVTEEELQEYVAKRVSTQKRLRGGVIFVPLIPKNPTGKILRRELRKKLASYGIQHE